MRIVLLASVATLVFVAPVLAHPTFIFNDNGGIPPGSEARAGFDAAAALWSSVFTNNVTIRIDVSFDPLGSNTLGATSLTPVNLNYADVSEALHDNAKSAAQISAAASLGSTLSFVSNVTPNGGVSPGTHFFDNNGTMDNKVLVVETANAKALGLFPSSDPNRDAWISMSSGVKWDYNSANGIAKGNYDFVGIAAHEIGHVLGFVSGVDSVDSWIGNGGSGYDTNAWGNPLDLFRYQNGQRDWTVGGTPCLSIDAGATCAARMASGTYYGDHRSASHWKQGLHLGIMDPVANAGQTLQIGPNDLLAFNVIGWNLATPVAANPRIVWTTSTSPTPGSIPNGPAVTALPEPGAFILFGLGFTGLALLRGQIGRAA